MTPLEFRLVNDFQRAFPLERRPFARIARDCRADAREVIDAFRSLRARGAIGRIGAVFRPNTVGASMLAAIEVPEHDLDRVAALVSARDSVNHNYARDHAVNLWFVATAPDAAALEAEIVAIEADTGLAVLRCPLVEPYHIDLGFDLSRQLSPRRDGPERTAANGMRTAGAGDACTSASPGSAPVLDEADRRLMQAIEQGLPLAPRPYDRLAARAGLSVPEVQARMARWQAEGIVHRFGVIVRHAALGYVANAMAVWDVPQARVRGIGQALAAEPRVTLCYQRARSLPRWRFNLYCMVHGHDRAEVTDTLAALVRKHALQALPHAVLFRRHEYKQTGARYRHARVDGHA